MEEYYFQKLSFLLALLHSKINNIFICIGVFHLFSYFQQLHRLEYRNMLPQEESRAHFEIVSGI